MATTITQTDVMNLLHNQMGHRVPPGGTEADLERYVQSGFDYCWRYYKWTFSLKRGTVLASDSLLPADFDLDGFRVFDGVTETRLESALGGGTAIQWNTTENRYEMTPALDTSGSDLAMIYQYTPPTLGTTPTPFPSAIAVAEAALVYAKMGENPTRADIQQEWDLTHSLLDRLVGRADNNKPRTVTTYLDRAGTFVGDVGA
jgi:hypothetical protein